MVSVNLLRNYNNLRDTVALTPVGSDVGENSNRLQAKLDFGPVDTVFDVC